MLGEGFGGLGLGGPPRSSSVNPFGTSLSLSSSGEL